MGYIWIDKKWSTNWDFGTIYYMRLPTHQCPVEVSNIPWFLPWSKDHLLVRTFFGHRDTKRLQERREHSNVTIKSWKRGLNRWVLLPFPIPVLNPFCWVPQDARKGQRRQPCVPDHLRPIRARASIFLKHLLYISTKRKTKPRKNSETTMELEIWHVPPFAHHLEPLKIKKAA